MRFQKPFIFVFIVSMTFVLASASYGQNVELAQPVIKTVEGQTEKQARRSLESFRRINDHPFFEMHFYGDYAADKPRELSSRSGNAAANWACSIFVSYGIDGSAIYGRNFDWFHNPALLLHTNPSDGYASISMVDISYLGFDRNDEKFNTVKGREALLIAPMLPFDGMNEHGLTVGMAAVGDTKIPNDPNKTNVGSLQIIRLMLDRARTVEEALAVFDEFNVVKRGGPNIHYLVADAAGKSAVIELKDGKKNIMIGERNWQSATNFYLTGQDNPVLQCHRFAKIHRLMKDKKGSLSVEHTIKLLKDISQENTQWSVVYDLKNSSARVATARNFNSWTEFKINPEAKKDVD